MINNRISYTAALPSDLAVPAFIGSGAALSTTIYLTSQAACPSLPDLSMYNNVSVLLCVGPGGCSNPRMESSIAAYQPLPSLLQVYNSIIGVQTGFNFLTHSGGSVQWTNSAIQVSLIVFCVSICKQFIRKRYVTQLDGSESNVFLLCLRPAGSIRD